MPSPIRRLPDSELALMQIIWQLDSPVSRTDIESALAGRRPLAATTILTFLSRLCDKGFLAVERHGKTNVYTPLVSQKDYLASESPRHARPAVRRFADCLCRFARRRRHFAPRARRPAGHARGGTLMMYERMFWALLLAFCVWFAFRREWMYETSFAVRRRTEKAPRP